MQDELGLNLYDLGARGYDPARVQFGSIDPLADEFPSTSPYAFVNNNPIFFTDPTGMAPETIYENSITKERVEVKDGIDKTIVVNDSDFQKAKFFSNEISDFGTVGKGQGDIANGYRDFYDSVNSYDSASIANIYDMVFGGPNIKVEGQPAETGGALIELTGGIGKKSVTQLAKLAGKTVKLQKHHIIPKAIYKKYKSLLKPFMKLGGGFNLKKLPTPFHGNHPQYNTYVGNKIQGLINGGNLNAGSLGNLQKSLNSQLNRAYNSGLKINDYFRKLNP